MGYILKEVKDNLKRYRFSSQICIWSIAMTLLFAGIFMVFAVNLMGVIKSFSENVEIVAFLKANVDSKKISQVKRNISELKNVRSVKYKSPEEALLEFTRDSDLAKQIEIIGENPLPDSFSIRLKVESAELMAETAKEIEKYDIIDEVRYGREEVNNLVSFVNTVKFSGIVFIIILVIMTLTIIGYTIRLAVHIRGQEIRVMKLVGATQWFIRMPFVVEGIIQGCIGGLLAIGLLYLVYEIIVAKLEGLVFLTPVYLGLIVVIGIVLGIIGNLLGIEKDLRTDY